jgi:RNA polymerase sigma-70 factor (ECF subfamily)
MAEAEALACLQQGDIEGLAWLVERYQVRAVRAAFLIVHDEGLAREVVQTAFLRLYERIGQFDQERPFAPWFFRIVVNDALKAIRHHKRLASWEELAQAGEVALQAQLPSPEESLTAAMQREAVWQALQQLTPGQRAAVVMRYYLDMSEQEMSEQLQVAPGTVKWRLHQARQRLRELLRGEWLEVK